jgi:hypothetical protein
VVIDRDEWTPENKCMTETFDYFLYLFDYVFYVKI